MVKATAATNDLMSHYGGCIQGLLEDKTITEICVDSFDYVYIERDGLLVDTDAKWESELALVQYIKQIANSLGLVVNNENPLLDARLPGNARINATLRPVSVNGACMSIRPFPSVHRTMDDLLKQGAITDRALSIIKAGLENKLNIIAAGGTGSGKTSFLRAMIFLIDATERLGIVEDTQENIAPFHKRKVEMEAPRGRSFSASKSTVFQDITLPILIEEVLRKRIDRLIVGEIRKPAACAAFLDAMSTGHGGCAGSLHASSSLDVIDRLTTLYARQAANISRDAIDHYIRSNLDLSIYLSRDVEKDEYNNWRVSRRIKEITWIGPDRKARLLMQHRLSSGYSYYDDVIEEYKNFISQLH